MTRYWRQNRSRSGAPLTAAEMVCLGPHRAVGSNANQDAGHLNPELSTAGEPFLLRGALYF
jgi:hypothetical protein